MDAFFATARGFGRFALREPLTAQRDEAGEPRPVPTAEAHSIALPALTVERRAPAPLHRLQAFLDATDARVLLLAESAGRRETLAQLMAEHGIELPQLDTWQAFLQADHRAALGIGPLSEGFAIGARVAVVTEIRAVLGAPKHRGHRGRDARTDVDALIRDLSELKIGDPVVHSQHGIGRYQGLVELDLGDGPTEFLHLNYAGDATLYVPVSQLHLIGALLGRLAGRSAAAPARLRPVGKGQAPRRAAGARHRRRAAQPLRAPRRAPGPRVRIRRTRLRGVRRRLRLRRDARPARRDPRGRCRTWCQASRWTG